MNNRQYIIANFLKKFGIVRKQRRLQDAATELQLLKEAEEILGRNVWQNLKDLEYYKVNYWGINKLLQERENYTDKIIEIKSKIEAIKQNQETRFKEVNNPGQNIEEIHDKQKIIVEKIQSEQQDISNIATNIKRSYDGVVAKLEAIQSGEPTDAEINAEQSKLEQLKKKFADLKEKKLLSDTRLAKQNAVLAKITDSLKSSKNTYKDNAAGNYEVMAKANKAISAYRSKIGLLDNQIITHYGEIGRNISKEAFSDDECRKAVKGKFNLCKIMGALRKSIDFNHNIADR